jgi:hypothetical protein
MIDTIWSSSFGREIFYMYYIEEDNIFADQDYYIIYNPFLYITPNDLFLFRYDNAHNLFPMVDNPNILCQIVPIPDELIFFYEGNDIDIGDDYERIGRYERAGRSKCF